MTASVHLAWRSACQAVPGGSQLWGYETRAFGELSAAHRTPLTLWSAVLGDVLANAGIETPVRLAPVRALVSAFLPVAEKEQHLGLVLLEAFNSHRVLSQAEFVVPDADGGFLEGLLELLGDAGLGGRLSVDAPGRCWFGLLCSHGPDFGWFSSHLAQRLGAVLEHRFLTEALPAASCHVGMVSARL